jgi:hypothetical protein
MPAFLANFLEPRFARPARVVLVDDVAKGLRRVRFQGAGWSKRSILTKPYWADGKPGL